MSAQTNNKTNISNMNVSQLTPKLGIAFFVIIGLTAAVWLWTTMLFV